MAKQIPVRELRSDLSRIDRYDALEETAEILSDPEAIAALEAGLGEVERGETVTLSDLRDELDARRAAG